MIPIPFSLSAKPLLNAGPESVLISRHCPLSYHPQGFLSCLTPADEDPAVPCQGIYHGHIILSLKFKVVRLQEGVGEEILKEIRLRTLVRGTCFADFVMATLYTAIVDLVDLLPHVRPVNTAFRVGYHRTWSRMC